ncbi:MAG: PorP/SprF family type IX secretion system membrane protein, partial [Bacteroidetes bacterium]|nr:PorP/SprF family type IX secretion system membrane protein [Bacteroidota bacterium]
FVLGRRTQWRNFPLAPETNFAGIVKDFGRKGYRRYWHGVGMYFEQDKFGMFNTKIFYGTYAIRLKLAKKTYLSFGLAVGTKTVEINNSLYNILDPALTSRSGKVLLYPDLVPGVYFYSRKLTMGISVKNLYKNSLKQGNQQIGTPTKLIPITYITASRKFRSSNYDYTIVPAVQIQSTFTSIPLPQFNCMVYYRKNTGIGLTYRMHDAVTAIIQLRLFGNLVISFAYDYTISKFRAGAANSTEIMFGYVASDGNEYEGGANVAQCPKFDY